MLVRVRERRICVRVPGWLPCSLEAGLAVFVYPWPATYRLRTRLLGAFEAVWGRVACRAPCCLSAHSRFAFQPPVSSSHEARGL